MTSWLKADALSSYDNFYFDLEYLIGCALANWEVSKPTPYFENKTRTMLLFGLFPTSTKATLSYLIPFETCTVNPLVKVTVIKMQKPIIY